MHIIENDLPTWFWNGAKKYQTLPVCLTKTGREFLDKTSGQPFTYFDFLTYVISNGDFPLYDRQVKQYNPEFIMKDANTYIDWIGQRNPDVAYAIRFRDIETFGNIVEEDEAEPTLFSIDYCPRARGNGHLGDCCNSKKKGKGCLKDAGLKCGM